MNEHDTWVLDSWIHENIMTGGGTPSGGAPPRYSTTLHLAWAVVEECVKNWFVDISDRRVKPDVAWHVRFWMAEPMISHGVGYTTGEEEYVGEGETIMLAICRAARKLPVRQAA